MAKPDANRSTGSSFEAQPGYDTEIPYVDQYYLASGAAGSGGDRRTCRQVAPVLPKPGQPGLFLRSRSRNARWQSRP